MKKLIIIIFALTYSLSAKSAKLSVLFSPNYFNQSSNVSGGGTSSINSILSNYSVTDFYQQVPSAANLNHYLVPQLLRYYIIEVPDSQLNNLYADLNGHNFVEHIAVHDEEALPTQCPETEPCTSDDPETPWTLTRHDIMQVREAWCITRGSENISVALFDRSYNNNCGGTTMEFHQDLDQDKITFIEPGAESFNGDCCHGLASAGAIGAVHDNNIDRSGSAPGVNLMFYDSFGIADDFCDAAARGAAVITASICYRIDPDDINRAENVALQCITDLGVTFVMAAGNGPIQSQGRTDNCEFAMNENTISISGVTHSVCFGTTYRCFTGLHEEFRNHSHNDGVDFVAQSFCVSSLTCNDGVGLSEGTSIAAPAVAGVIALIKSVNPCLVTSDVINLMKATQTSTMDIEGYDPDCDNESFYPNGEVPGIPNAYQAVCEAENWCGEPVSLSDQQLAQTGCPNGCSGDRLISGDLIVESGTTLTITGQFSFAKCSRVIVKHGAILNIDGGILTACADEWKGIIVEGSTGDPDNENGIAGKVIMTNGAIIENARTAISMNPSHLPWTDQMWGGYVRGENSTIRNCHRAVEFMKHGQDGIKDKSSFYRMNFVNLSNHGTTCWANDGVQYNNCLFSNIGEIGMLLHSSAADVNNISTFVSVPIGIDVLYPGGPGIFGSNIDGNDFRCSTAGIYMSTAFATEDFKINGNLFRGGSNGIVVDGLARFRMTSNTFSSHAESVLFMDSGGLSQNFIKDNEFTNATFGNKFEFDNGGSTFLTNCYSSISSDDILISGIGGRVFPEIGDKEFEAGNCFTKLGIPEINNSAGNILKYFIWEGHIPGSGPQGSIACQFTENSSNITIEPSQNESPLDCGYGDVFFNDPNSCEESMLVDVEEILSLISKLDENREKNDGDYFINDMVKNRLLLNLSYAVFNQESPGESEYDKEFLINYYNRRPEFMSRIITPALYVSDGDYKKAKSSLRSIPTTNRNEANYIKVQETYYRFLEHGAESISQTQINVLKSTGLSFGPINGFARSIYYLITGERLRLEEPRYKSIEKRANEKADISRQIRSYPNPVNNNLLYVEVRESEEETYKIGIVDLNGKLIKQTSVRSNDKLSISTDHLSSGVYILNISNEKEGIIHTDKIIVIE